MKSSQLIWGVILGVIAGSIATFFISQERYDLETLTAEDAERMISDGLVNYEYLTCDEPLFEAMQYIQQEQAGNGVEYYKTSHAVVVGGGGSLDFATTGYTNDARQLGNYAITPFNSNVGPCPNICNITAVGPGPSDDGSIESVEEGVDEPMEGEISIVTMQKEEAESLIDDKQSTFKYLVYNDKLRQAMHYLKDNDFGDQIAYFRTYVGVRDGNAYIFLTTGLTINGDQFGDFVVTPFDGKVGPCPHNCDFGD